MQIHAILLYREIELAIRHQSRQDFGTQHNEAWQCAGLLIWQLKRANLVEVREAMLPSQHEVLLNKGNL